MKKRVVLILTILAVLCGVLAGGLLWNKEDKLDGIDCNEASEIAYSDIISEIVVGYQTHWSETSPEDSGLSSVYRYESEYGSFARKDIDGDGIEELLIGDDFGDGTYQLYDIFTFDSNKRSPVHILSGGERDSFVLSGSGIIVESGSSSAFESFVRYYKIENAAAKEYSGLVEEDLMALQFEKFLRYVAPTAYVAIKNGDLQGHLIKTFDDCYLIEVQDTVRIAREGVEIQLWSAFDGKGVIYPSVPGKYPVYKLPEKDSVALGEIEYESGYAPQTFACLGYIPGWFKIIYAGKVGFVDEKEFTWDIADRH